MTVAVAALADVIGPLPAYGGAGVYLLVFGVWSLAAARRGFSATV